MKIQEKGWLHRGPMSVEGGTSLREVLTVAVVRAEQNGWHLPGFVGPPTLEQWEAMA